MSQAAWGQTWLWGQVCVQRERLVAPSQGTGTNMGSLRVKQDLAESHWPQIPLLEAVAGQGVLRHDPAQHQVGDDVMLGQHQPSPAPG